jgi:hypothetical protein
MVHCPNCYNELPYDCTCKIPPSEKLRRFLVCAKREVNLMLAIFEGYKPIIQVETQDGIQEIVPEIIKADDYWLALKFTLKPPRSPQVTLKLLDMKGKPLYVRKQTLTQTDELKVSWFLGVPR